MRANKITNDRHRQYKPDRLACSADRASSSAITKGNALANFFASSCCFVASLGRRDKRDCAITLGVVLLLLRFNREELDESSVKSSDEIFRFTLAGLLVLVDMVICGKSGLQ